MNTSTAFALILPFIGLVFNFYFLSKTKSGVEKIDQ